VLKVANELNIKVPDELSVVGMTNERMSELTVPSLTTVGIPFEEIGHAGMVTLIELIESKREMEAQEITRFACTPVFRDSSATASSS
jgi:GntR family transcriptional regulator of arabinose operon